MLNVNCKKKEHIWAIFFKISHPKFFYKGLLLNNTNNLQYNTFFDLEYRIIFKSMFLHIVAIIN